MESRWPWARPGPRSANSDSAPVPGAPAVSADRRQRPPVPIRRYSMTRRGRNMACHAVISRSTGWPERQVDHHVERQVPAEDPPRLPAPGVPRRHRVESRLELTTERRGRWHRARGWSSCRGSSCSGRRGWPRCRSRRGSPAARRPARASARGPAARSSGRGTRSSARSRSVLLRPHRVPHLAAREPEDEVLLPEVEQSPVVRPARSSDRGR